MSAYRAFADVYDILTQNVNYRQRADYICSLLCDCGKTNGILLDAACGTGSLSELFAEKGYDVIGVDSSVGMLMQAQQKKYESGLDILYLNQNICNMDLYGTVDCAVCSLDSINHLPSADKVAEAFHSIGFFMEKDGIFIFDVNTRYKHETILGNHTFTYEAEEVFCVWQNTFDPQQLRTDIHLDLFFPQDDVYTRACEDFAEWYYSDAILTEKLQDANFEVLHRFGELTKQEPGDREERIYYVCRKRKTQ